MRVVFDKDKTKIIKGVVFDKFRNPQFQQIFSIVVLFNGFRLKYLSTILMKLGELSVYMWFVHALFFTQCVRHIYQPLILVSNNVYVVTLWTMFLTTIIAWVLHSAVSRFQRLVNY